jgi:alpha-glucosidase (family GH31 glycosyl hydrolase)
MSPTKMLNYVFYSNPNHWRNGRRPALLHRWGGLGNHRYQSGFSGDTWPTWAQLSYQTYFTSVASNVS